MLKGWGEEAGGAVVEVLLEEAHDEQVVPVRGEAVEEGTGTGEDRRASNSHPQQRVVDRRDRHLVGNQGECGQRSRRLKIGPQRAGCACHSLLFAH